MPTLLTRGTIKTKHSSILVCAIICGSFTGEIADVNPTSWHRINHPTACATWSGYARLNVLHTNSHTPTARNVASPHRLTLSTKLRAGRVFTTYADTKFAARIMKS